MKAIYILVSFILLIVISTFIYYYSNQEGFSDFSVRSDFGKKADETASHKLNKPLYLNPFLKDDIKKINDAMNLRDTNNFKVKTPNDYTKLFMVNPLPGLEADSAQCAAALEPRLLPRHDSKKINGCGWWYVDDDYGQSTGSLGTSSGPFLNTLETSNPGGIWMWDLELAQKKEDIKQCRRIKSCELADMIPGKCGFCVDQNRGIPVNSKGQSTYKDDPDLSCDLIVTKPIKCPKPEPIPGVSTPVVGLCDPNPATGQLTNDCLIALAKGAGFMDAGAAINILSGNSEGYYNGKNSLIFESVKSVIKQDASITSSNEFFGYGPCSRAEALGYYTSIVKLIKNGANKKVRSAASFLAFGSEFDNCPENLAASGPFDLSCLERVALEAGCQRDGTDFPMELKPVQNNAPPYCKRYGYPDADNRIRLYTQEECNALTGNFHGNGECTKREGGSFSWDCRELNNLDPNYVSTKDKYDGMKWGSVIDYFTNLYSQMNSSNKDKSASATKKCLGIEITPLDADCGDITGVYCYCYKWDYDSAVVDGRPPKSMFYGRFHKTSMVEFNNSGDYTPFGLGTNRIHLRMKTTFKTNTSQITNLWVSTSDGVGIIADDKIVLQKWFDQKPTQYETSKFKITDGQPLKIQINWYNNMGGYTFVPRIKVDKSFVKIPDTLLFLDQPTGYPFARWDFYEGKVEDRCNTFNSEVVGNIPIGVCDGKRCGFFQNKNYVQITNGISAAAFKSISMMIYLRAEHSGWPRLWEFNNTALAGQGSGSWCDDSVFGCLSPGNGLGIGFYVQNNCGGPSTWSGANTAKVGRWYHIVWALDESLTAYTMYLDGQIVFRTEDSRIAEILTNKVYKNMYIVNSVELFSKDVGVAWFRMFDYTMTAADVKIDMNNGWSTDTLFPKTQGTGW